MLDRGLCGVDGWVGITYIYRELLFFPSALSASPIFSYKTQLTQAIDGLTGG